MIKKLTLPFFLILFIVTLVALMITHIATYQPLDFFQQWFLWLLYTDLSLIVIMMLIVVAMAWRLILSWRRGDRGARLSLRLTLLLLAMSLLPPIMLYAVSTGGIFRSIESWFDTPLNRAFEKGIEFGQDVLGHEFERLEQVSHDVARSLSAQRGSLPFRIDDLRLLHQLDSLSLFDQEGNLLIASGLTDRDAQLSGGILRQLARDELSFQVTEGSDRAIEVIIVLSNIRDGYALKVSRTLPAGLADGLDEIAQGYHQYENLLLLRQGLRLSFTLTLTLSLALILLVVGWLSLRLGRILTRPMVHLSAAATAVGRGDFSYRLRNDHYMPEVAELNQSFNAMVSDLQQSRQQAQQRQSDLHEANAYLENLLISLTTGVMTLSEDGHLSRYNTTAEKLFHQPLVAQVGQHKTALARLPLLADVIAVVDKHALAPEEPTEARVQSINSRVLLIRVVSLSSEAGGGVLVMGDDITRQMRAEREATWEEASRRFVHEIKNPLTPIQLAAERLGKKLGKKLDKNDTDMLDRLVETIVHQVTAMRQMVDSFRGYADEQRFFSQPIDINMLLREVLPLYEDRGICLQLFLQTDLPPIAGESVALRQVFHNLLGNAVEATERLEMPTIWLETRMIGTDKISLTIEDNGGGVAEDMLHKMCEPYVTTKQEGTGLGLAVVRKTVDEHRGALLMENGNRGLRVVVYLPLSANYG